MGNKNPFEGIGAIGEASTGVDQRLFTSRPTVPVPSPSNGSVMLGGTAESPNPPSLQPSSEGKREGGQEASREGGKEVSRTERFDINVDPYRKLSVLVTNGEAYGLEDVKTDLARNLDLACSKQDLVRCAIHHLIEDYRVNREKGFAARRLRLKNN